MREWWVIEGVRRPVYVWLQGRRGRRAQLYVALSFIAMIIGEILSFLPPGTAMLAASLLVVGEAVASFIGSRRAGLREMDIPFIRSALKAIGDLVVEWSVAGIYVPAACRLRDGRLLYLAYLSGRLYVIVVRPRLYLGLARGAGRIRLWRERRGWGLVAPMPGDPRVWYRILGDVVAVEAKNIQPLSIRDILEGRSRG